MAIEPRKTEHHETVKEQVIEFIDDLSSEVKQEFSDIRTSHQLVESSQADLTVRRHVNGLVISLFALVALMLLAGIGGIAWYGHWYQHAQALPSVPGMFVPAA